jgi:hypothetical protein
MRADHKYTPLGEWLSLKTSNREVISFSGIEELLGDRLPNSARLHRPWWGNELGSKSRHCQVWQGVGWKVEEVDLTGEQVVFVRQL